MLSKISLEVILISIVALIAPIKATLITAGSLIMLDFVLGIAAAVKQKIPITSHKMRDTIAKVLVYESAIIISYLMQHFLMGDQIPVVNLCGTYIALTEGTSVLENLSLLSGQNLLQGFIEKINNLKKSSD